MALQASFVLHVLQFIPSQPSLHSQSWPWRGSLLWPSASEPHSGCEQSSPPKPEGQAHLPLDCVQLAYWWHWKLSRLQLKHGGQSSGRSPYIEKDVDEDSELEKSEWYWFVLYAVAEDSRPAAASHNTFIIGAGASSLRVRSRHEYSRWKSRHEWHASR
jgi:hypothetical protein